MSGNTCYNGPGHEWYYPLNNTKNNNENPCQTANKLYSTCGLDLPGVPETLGDTNTNCCLASPFIYQTSGACIACKFTNQTAAAARGFIRPFAEWRASCPQSSTDLSSEVAQWVVLLQTMDHFDVNIAMGAGAQSGGNVTAFGATTTTDAGAPPAPSASSSKSTAPAAPPNASPSTSVAESSASGGSKSNIGPIVGGIIAAIVVLGVLGFAAWFFLKRRKRQRTAPSAEFTRYMQQPTLNRPESFQPKPPISPMLGGQSESIPLTSGYEETDLPPAFTPGRYVGPVFEKEGYVADPVSPQYSSPSATVVAPQSSTAHSSGHHPDTRQGSL